MKPVVDQLLGHARGIWRFRMLAVLIAWCVALSGWLIVLAWPDAYQAQAQVYVDTSSALRPLLQGLAVDSDIDSQLNLVRETLLGRAQLTRVARDADLDLKAKTPEDRDDVVAALRQGIAIDAVVPGAPKEGRRSTDSIYTITYQNPNRDRALIVVRSLLNSLVEDTLGGKRNGADEAQKFLREQIADYEKRLGVSEAALAEFKKRNVGLVPGAQGDYFSRLQGEIAASKKAQTALDLAVRRRGELDRQLKGEKAFVPGSTAGATVPGQFGAQAGAGPGGQGGGDTASRVLAAQARLDDLLLRFTDKHPDVVAARETLAQLKARQAQELEALRRGDPAAVANSGLSTNPVYQSIQLQLNQTDVEIAALRGELSEHERSQAELKRVVNTAPEVEAEFARLNRDYDVTKAQYNVLLDRLDKAKLSDDAQQTGMVRFEVINPPHATLEPVAPKRPALIAIVLLVAIGAGAGVAWLMSQLKPVLTNSRALAELTGLPVLGSVAMTWLDRATAEFRRGVFVVIGAGAGLALVCLTMLVLHQTGSRMIHRLVNAG